MSKIKYFCFRFDVDTHKCLRDGVPKLLRLTAELGVKSTFFVNPGQAVNVPHFLQSKFEKKSSVSSPAGPSLSALKKLGWQDYLIAATLNPVLSRDYGSYIQQITAENHELGLHGGHNHELWMAQANRWPVHRVQAEIRWGKKQLEQLVGKKIISGFASPGWTTSPRIQNVLLEEGFAYIADIHSSNHAEKVLKKPIINLPTTLTGEPGGIGYIENSRARGLSDNDILQNFAAQLKLCHRLAVVYDHPYFAGTQAISLTRQMYTIALEQGFKVTTLSEIAKSL